MTITCFVGAKGGVSTSTTAARFALGRPTRTLLVDLADGSMSRLLGLMHLDVGDRIVSVTDRLSLATPVFDPVDTLPVGEYDDVVFDLGVCDQLEAFEFPREWQINVVGVTTACYLALGQAVRSRAFMSASQVVLLMEPHRALQPNDVRSTLGLPVTPIAHDPAVARCIDAGLLAQSAARYALNLDVAGVATVL